MKQPNILVVGSSGTGKSTSIRNLDPKKTMIINVEQKKLPFKAKFEKEVICKTPAEFKALFSAAIKSTEVDTIVVDSLSALQELIMIEAKRIKKGFDIFTYYNDTVQDILIASKDTEKLVIFLTLAEVTVTPTGESIMKAKVEGKKLTDYIETNFTIVLHTETAMTEDGMQYRFVTNNDGRHLAKSPMDMFEELFIPNDLSIVKEAIKNYYEGE